MVCRLILVFVFAGLLPAGGAAGHSSALPTFWIGPSRSQQQRTLVVEKQFDVGGRLAAASLRMAADFCDATLSLNGHHVVTATPYDHPLPLSVRRWCKVGQNTLTVRLSRHGGPSAVAIVLELSTRAGEQKVVRSDSTWQIRGPTPQHVSVDTFGRIDDEAWWQVTTRPMTDAFDEYNQWEEALSETGVGHATIRAADGFEVSEVFRVPQEHGSWISMAIDDQGRLLFGRESKGIVRLTLPAAGGRGQGDRGGDAAAGGRSLLEVVHRDLRGIHGLLWSDGHLFVSASDSKGLYRLDDTTGDDRFDAVRLLRNIPGGGGDHGRNDLVRAADGSLLLIVGDAVDIPEGFRSRVPLTREFAKQGRPKGGHVIRTDTEGSLWEIIVSGLRNPYGIDFNHDGELFTYDADSERHVGLPWYRPTRMNHLVSGADYGWRSRGELPWPIYRADILPPNVLIGRGSPTGVKFGYRSHFPEPFRSALFALDWAFGRVFAVQVVPRGASYSMHPRVLLQGRPFNVVDLEFAADGSLYLLTGGYQTRSALYRLRYVGQPVARPKSTLQELHRAEYSREVRALRGKLEAYQAVDAAAVSFCWSYLDHADPWIRHAARVAIEHQPVTVWEHRIWAEAQTERWLTALLAYVRISSTIDKTRLWRKLEGLTLAQLASRQQMLVVRILQWLDEFEEEHHLPTTLVDQLEEIYPSLHVPLNRELCSLLTAHGSNRVVAKTLQLLDENPRQEDALHYLLALSQAANGWSGQRRDAYFRLIQGSSLFQGDETFVDTLRQLQRNALAMVPIEQRVRYESLLELTESEGVTSTPPRPFVRDWTTADFGSTDFQGGYDRQVGERVFREALCDRCHRMGGIGRAVGPDLTGVGRRFSRVEVLESILEPSEVVSSRYANHVVITADGQTYTGQIVWNGFRKSVLRIATDPLNPHQATEIAKRKIVSHKPSSISPMPDGLLDSFTRAEIESLLTYLQAGE